MVSEKMYYKVHVTFQAPKVSANKAYKRNCVPEFPVLSVLKYYLLCACDFYRYDHIYTYRRKEFQNIFERKLCNCFGQLYVTYLFTTNMLNMELNMTLIVLIDLH